MGYRRVPTIYTLEFDKYEGLIVRMKSVKIGQLRKLIAIVESDDRTDEMIDQVVDLFARSLASWNLEHEDTGEEMPATRESIEDLEMEFLFDLVGGWMNAMTGVGDDLGKDSPSTEQFPGRPVTMEAL